MSGETMRQQSATGFDNELMRSHMVTASQNKRNINATPHAFTGKSISICPIPPRRFKRKTELAVKVSFAGIFISSTNFLHRHFHF